MLCCLHQKHVSANEPSDEPNWELRKVRFPLAFLARCFAPLAAVASLGSV